jgi:putative hydrolase of the HAD superfamily
MMVTTVLLDFYGTLAEAVRWGPSFDTLLERHGASIPNEVRQRFTSDSYDGHDLSEHAASREAYVSWEIARYERLLAESGLDAPRVPAVARELWHAAKQYELRLYDDVPDALEALRSKGLRLVICSNWDWDLPDVVESLGLTAMFDVVVTSARAGSRKPHPQIYRHTLERAAAEPGDAIFVGDSWGPDVVGPTAAGIRAVHVARAGREPDPSWPADDALPAGTHRITELCALVELL